MQSRKLFFGGNWKCNNTLVQTKTLVEDVVDKLEFDPSKVGIHFSKIDVIVAPIFLHLSTVLYTKKNQNVKVAAQNCSKNSNGAFTGEVSAEQLKDMNLEWIIIGHSERRTHFKESNEDLSLKVKQALLQNLKVIYCFGETLEQRENNQTINVVKNQLEAIKEVVDNWDSIVLAYEPVWAIGTGKTATNEQVEEIHNWIRQWLQENIADKAEGVRIIYGGSVSEKNCKDLIKIKNVDGFLVGGASLKASFIEIVNSGNDSQ